MRPSGKGGDMIVRIPIGYKFILGFIAVVAAAAFIPDIIEKFDVVEWLRLPLSFLAAIVIGLVLGSFFTKSFTRQFGLLTGMAQKISKGDLTSAEELNQDMRLFKDEMADLEEALSLMAINLKGLVERISETVANLAEAQGMFSSVVTKGHETSKEVISGSSSIFD